MDPPHARRPARGARCARAQGPGPRPAPAGGAPGHPARLDRRLDLSRPPGAPAGDGAGRQGAQAVPLPPGLDGAPQPDQVRAAAPLRDRARALAQAHRARSRALRAAAGKGAGHGGPSPGDHAHPHRQPRLREAEPVPRPHHPARQARGGAGAAPALQLQGEERGVPLHRGGGPAPGAHRPPVPRHPRLRALPVLRRGGDGAHHRLRGRERLPARDHGGGLHGQGLPHLGGHGGGGRAAGRGRTAGDGRGGQGGGGGHDPGGGGAPGEPPHHLPQVLRAPGGGGWLPPRGALPRAPAGAPPSRPLPERSRRADAAGEERRPGAGARRDGASQRVPEGLEESSARPLAENGSSAGRKSGVPALVRDRFPSSP